jgi:hypothetical protein
MGARNLRLTRSCTPLMTASPGLIRMGDIDGAVEINGHILWLEWKVGLDNSACDEIHLAQLIQARAFTSNHQNQRFWMVVGDPFSMTVRYVRFMRGGAWTSDWIECDTEGLRDYLRRWSEMAAKSARVA